MDYKEIILNGYFDIKTRDNLDKYFFRMFKKAEKEEFFEPDEFFDELHSIVRSFEEEINIQLKQRKKDLTDWFTSEKNKDKKEFYKHQISCTEKDDFPLNMGNYRTLYYRNLKTINDAITKAHYKVGTTTSHPSGQPQQDNNTSNNETENDVTFSSFKDLFNDIPMDIVKQSIAILKQVKPPIITMNNKYNLGSKSKGSITAWITALKMKGFIKNNVSDINIATVLNNEIEGLNLGSDGRTLRNFETTSYKKYYKTILNLLPSLPLSTNGKNR